MLEPDRLDLEFDLLALSRSASRYDVRVRVGLLLISSLFLGLALELWPFAVWGFVFAAIDFCLCHLLRRTQKPVSTGRFLLLQTLATAGMLWIGAMAICVSYLDGGAYVYIAQSFCIGAAIFCLTCHVQFGLSAIADFVVVVLTALGIMAVVFLNAETLFLGVAAVVGGLSVLAYFYWALRRAIADRIALKDREEARVHDQKLKSLGQLTSGVAHDFNNLLTVIGGNVELAQLEATTREQEARLQDAQKGVARGAKMVSQLLAYSRKAPLNAKEVSSVDVLAEVDFMCGRVVPAGIAIEVDLFGPSANLIVDIGLLQTAILNLIINARDAVKDQRGTIWVYTRGSDAPQTLSIVVEDTGAGMDAVTMERATEPFFTTKPVGEGTGLGLSMVKGFVEQSGGHLELEHRPNGGLIAVMVLPVKTLERTP